MESFDTVILAFDTDEVGQKAALECAKILKPGTVRIAQYPEGCKDASDCLKAGVDLGHWLRFKSVDYRPDGIIRGDEMWERMLEYREGGKTKGYSLPCT